MEKHFITFDYVVNIGWDTGENSCEVELNDEMYNILVDYIESSLNDGTLSESEVMQFYSGEMDADDFNSAISDKTTHMNWPYNNREYIKEFIDKEIKKYEAQLISDDQLITIKAAYKQMENWGEFIYSLPYSLVEAVYEKMLAAHADEIEENKKKAEIVEDGVLRFVNRNIEGVYEIPDGVTTIATEALSLCSEITEIIFPKSVVTLKQEAIGFNCKLKSVHFNEGLKVIERCAIEHSEHIEQLIIPSTVEVIGRMAFSLHGLKRIEFLTDKINAETSSDTEALFWSSRNLEQIIVPKGCADKYKKLFPNQQDLIIEA